MSIDSLQLRFLKSIIGSIKTDRQSYAGSRINDDGAAEPEISDIVYSIINVADGTRIGLLRTALPDLDKLTRSLRKNREDYVRGASLGTMRKIVAKEIIKIFCGRSSDQVSNSDLADVKRKTQEWFNEATVARRHFVPVNILPCKARAFEFGPIRFFHASALDLEDYGVSAAKGAIDICLGPLINMMQNHAACWWGEILVKGYEKERSTEIAGLAMDVALGGLQLVVPSCYSRRIARITARTLPAYSGSFAVTDTGVENGIANQQPGLALSPERFETLISSASDEVAAMGRIIEAYVSGNGDLRTLKQAWCDAVYWFHEGMSEPLNSVAIVKLETAIENLFSAAGTRASKQRILDGLKGMFGIKKSDKIGQSSDTSFEKLVTDIVKARSRILHGTWPTLSASDKIIDRETVECIARNFLISYPNILEGYANESSISPKDETQAFLDWAMSNGRMID